MTDLKTLEQFVTFYHTGTLREAAQKLHISQSTLTRGMQKLEAEFGVPLFTRTGNSIALTETGRLAAEDAAHLLRSRGSGNIVVLRRAAEQQVADRPADDIRFKTGVLKLGNQTDDMVCNR